MDPSCSVQMVQTWSSICANCSPAEFEETARLLAALDVGTVGNVCASQGEHASHKSCLGNC